jgi:hypothetical protein
MTSGRHADVTEATFLAVARHDARVGTARGLPSTKSEGGVNMRMDGCGSLVMVACLLGATGASLASAQGSRVVVRGVVEGQEYFVPAALILDWEAVRPAPR